jgi:hypothetical protein
MKFLLFLVFFSLFSSANAAVCVKLVTGGTTDSIEPTSQPISECTDLVLFSKDEFTHTTVLISDAELGLITPSRVMTAFTFGFGTYAVFWFLGFKGRTARAAIKQI